MHMQGTPRTMQENPTYQDVTGEVRAFFEQRLAAARAAGIDADRIAFDPGIGFGKTVEHNLRCCGNWPRCRSTTGPSCSASRARRFLAKTTDAHEMSERLWPTVALTALLRERGARVLRVHDVRPNVAALQIAEALLPAG